MQFICLLWVNSEDYFQKEKYSAEFKFTSSKMRLWKEFCPQKQLLWLKKSICLTKLFWKKKLKMHKVSRLFPKLKLIDSYLPPPTSHFCHKKEGKIFCIHLLSSNKSFMVIPCCDLCYVRTNGGNYF